MMLVTQLIGCDEIDLPHDDFLGEIAVPVMCVGAGGGYGEFRGMLNSTGFRIWYYICMRSNPIGGDHE